MKIFVSIHKAYLIFVFFFKFWRFLPPLQGNIEEKSLASDADDDDDDDDNDTRNDKTIQI